MPYNGLVIKRTAQNKLTLYRRHAGSCPVTDAKTLDQCECPLWCHGKVQGKFIRTSLDTRSVVTALQRKEDLLSGRPDGDGPDGGLQVVPKNVAKGSETLEYAAAEFLKAHNKLAANTQTLYRRATDHFTAWAAKRELTCLRQIDTSHVAQYFEEYGHNWKSTTAQGRLVHLRVFFNYCCRSRRWIPFPPTQDRTLNHAKKTGKVSRVPFTPQEITRVLAAVEQMPAADRDRARALILLLLYTGMRISDATFFERAFVTERNTADFWVIKTRRQISLPPELQAPVLDALAKLPASRVYFFVPDADDDYAAARASLREGEEFSTLMPMYLSRVDETTSLVVRVLRIAGLTGRCHRFRDTFAINLLVSGADIYTVSQMLGHSDVKITAAHYLKAVPGYREKMSQATRSLAYQFPLAS